MTVNLEQVWVARVVRTVVKYEIKVRFWRDLSHLSRVEAENEAAWPENVENLGEGRGQGL